MKQKIAAVVVTYNREKLLIECLNSLISQNCGLDTIFIIDNKSAKATPELLKEEGWIDDVPELDSTENQLQNKKVKKGDSSSEVFYVRKKENDGGSGGFYEGIKQAYEHGYDYVWVMDDDVISEKNALEELLKARTVGDFGFLVSRVVGPNGISMNMPDVEMKMGENYYPVWDEFLDSGIVRVKSATFVSVFLPREVIGAVGYPVKEMFIWGDDTEYTLRISKKFPCYYIGKSLVCHKRIINKPPSIKTEKSAGRLKMHFYRFRNLVYTTRKHKKRSQLIVVLGEFLYKMMFLLIRLRFRSFYTMLKGMMAGLFFRPEIRFPK